MLRKNKSRFSLAPYTIRELQLKRGFFKSFQYGKKHITVDADLSLISMPDQDRIQRNMYVDLGGINFLSGEISFGYQSSDLNPYEIFVFPVISWDKTGLSMYTNANVSSSKNFSHYRVKVCDSMEELISGIRLKIKAYYNSRTELYTITFYRLNLSENKPSYDRIQKLSIYFPRQCVTKISTVKKPQVCGSFIADTDYLEDKIVLPYKINFKK